MELKDWILLGLIALGLLVWWLVQRPRKITGKKAAHSNTKVVQLLTEAGYEVLLNKPTVAVEMHIDGRAHPFELKEDFLVKRDGKRYIVRVRRDNKQARLHSKLWRGTLLRDVLAFSASGIVVVHLEKATLQEVLFRI